MPAICCLRGLEDSVALCAVNTALILVVIGVALSDIEGQGAPRGEDREEAGAFAPDLGLYSAMGAATNVLYSFAGQWMYFEIMSTMAEPADFPRVLAAVGPFMVVTYLVVAIAGLLLHAQGEDLLRSMHAGPARQVACLLLFAYVVVVYLIKSIILTRFVHGVISPQDQDSRSWTSYLKHSGIGLAMLWMGFLVANAVPFFSELLGLVGGLLSGPINFILPMALFLVARRRALTTISQPTDAESQEAEDQLEDTARSRDDASDEVASSMSEVSSAASTEASQSKDVETLGALCAMRPLDWALMACTVSFTLATMVLGVSDVLSQIASLEGQYGAPFTCKALVSS